MVTPTWTMRLATHAMDLDADGHDTFASGEVLDLSTTETDTTLRLAPDGAGGVEWATMSGGPGGSDDPVADVFGAPDTAYEFTGALSGWTNLGSATAQDADSTVPDHYYVHKAATGSVALTGIYRATGTFPQTFITKLSDHTLAGADYERVGGLFVGQASPGVIEAVYFLHNTDWTLSHERYTNPTTYNATVGTDIPQKGLGFPIYYGIVVNSSTDVDFWASRGGRVWRKRTDARDPSITVGSFGVFVDPENATHGVAGAFDFVRVWDSALTFPGF